MKKVNDQPFVYLVGAGPGDPELLTLKALRLIKEACVIVYDRLVSDEIIDLVPPGVTKIFAGKASSNHTLSQDEINDLLVKLAGAGHKVVRLKGGDPLVFGRGSEEALFLAKHGIACEFVPGITAAAGCAASAGIPLTHRGTASGVRFVTGHCKQDEALHHDWNSLADEDTTLAVYMGLANLDTFRGELLKAGLPAQTPVAAIANGTTVKQKVLKTSLDNMAEDIRAAGFRPPVLTMIGKVAAMDLLNAVEEHKQPAEQRAEKRIMGDEKALV